MGGVLLVPDSVMVDEVGIHIQAADSEKARCPASWQ